MSQYLPHSDFALVDNLDQFSPEFIQSLADNAEVGYVLEVDLEYPSTLHYPVAPENVMIQKEMLSDYSTKVLTTQDLKFTPCKKLTPNLKNKPNYVLHYRNLKLYLQLGLKLAKIHKVLSLKKKFFII